MVPKSAEMSAEQRGRRYLTERFDELAERYKRDGEVFSLILCDIDSRGCECEDRLLFCLRDRLASYCRETDIVARWNGDEFLLLLPDTDRAGAAVLAKRIRRNLEGDGICMNVTMTFGVTEYRKSEKIRNTVKRADAALLRGKHNGGNRVVPG